MPKIILRGTPPSEKIMLGKCSTCGTTYEAQVGELEVVNDRNDIFYSAKCEVCDTGTAFYYNEKPTLPTCSIR